MNPTGCLLHFHNKRVMQEWCMITILLSCMSVVLLLRGKTSHLLNLMTSNCYASLNQSVCPHFGGILILSVQQSRNWALCVRPNFHFAQPIWHQGLVWILVLCVMLAVSVGAHEWMWLLGETHNTIHCQVPHLLIYTVQTYTHTNTPSHTHTASRQRLVNWLVGRLLPLKH